MLDKVLFSSPRLLLTELAAIDWSCCWLAGLGSVWVVGCEGGCCIYMDQGSLMVIGFGLCGVKVRYGWMLWMLWML